MKIRTLFFKRQWDYQIFMKDKSKQILVHKGLFTWRRGDRRQVRLHAAGHPTYRVNVIKLKRGIIWTGGLPYLNGLPHLPGVPHLHVNRPLRSKKTQYRVIFAHGMKRGLTKIILRILQISIYTLSDLGNSSNLIGWLSRTMTLYSPRQAVNIKQNKIAVVNWVFCQSFVVKPF